MRFAALQLIRLYQRLISPLLGPACRYTPTCSQYAAEAIELHGARGLWMAACRLLRCHPFSRGGFDPVRLPNQPVEKAEGSHLTPRASSLHS